MGAIRAAMQQFITSHARDAVDIDGGEIIVIGVEGRDKPLIITFVGKYEPKDVEKILKLAGMTSLER